MALLKSSVVPEDAVVLNEEEAITYIWDVVNNWESVSDIWALRYAPAMLGSLNSVCGVLINNHFRKKLKLGGYGYFASIVPIAVMPGLLTALFHRHLVATDMLLMKMDGCPLCYEMRSGFTQLILGVAYPLLLGSTSALMFANRYCTYRVPDIRQEPKVLLKFIINKTKPFTGSLTSMVAIQLAASSILTYFEMRNNITFKSKLMEIEKKALSENPPV